MGHRRKCQTYTASPAEPGGLPVMLGGPAMSLENCSAKRRYFCAKVRLRDCLGNRTRRLYRWMLDCPAYLFLSCQARAVLSKSPELGGEENRVIHSHITAMMTGKWAR
jgi:hypothetical protein